MPKKVDLTDPTGRTIVKVRQMTPQEMEDESWENESTKPTVLELDNGTLLYPSRDDEGNGPGNLFGKTKKGKQFQIFFTEKKP